MTARYAATLRLAWRLVRKAPARSVLIAVLVAIPVMAGTFAAVTIRTASPSPEQAARWNLGGADAIALVTDSVQDPWAAAIGRSGSEYATSEGGGRPLRHPPGWAGWTATLPASSRVVPDAWGLGVRLATTERRVSAVGIALDLDDPVTHGIYSVGDGDVPTSADEVAVTPHLAKRLRITVGDRLALERDPSPGVGRRFTPAVGSVTVTAVVRNPRALSTDQIVAAPETFGDLTVLARASWDATRWLVDTPGAAPDLHDDLAREGVIYETRTQWMQPPAVIADDGTTVAAQAVIVIGTVVLFGLLEVVLLAGTAFAVGARRQAHDLGLVMAAGGDARDVRRVVVAQGAFLGVLGGTLGLVGGVALVFFGRPVLERFADQALGSLDVVAGDVVAFAVLGVAAGCIAALVPAYAAGRREVLALLRERFPGDSSLPRNPRWATAAVAAGSALVVLSAVAWRSTAGGFSNTNVRVSDAGDIGAAVFNAMRDNRWATGIWLGGLLALAGVVRSTPWLLGRLGRVGARLPLSPRLALRDASRHRHRTAPAIAAVATVLTATTVVLFVASSSDARDRASYRPAVPLGTIDVSTADESQTALDAAVEGVLDLVGPADVARLARAQLRRPHRSARYLAVDTCASADYSHGSCFGPVGIASPDTLGQLVPAFGAAGRQAFLSGEAVVLRTSDAPSLTSVDVHPAAAATGRHGTTLQAVTVRSEFDYYSFPSVFVSPATAAALGWSLTGAQAIITPEHLPTDAAVARLNQRLGHDVGLLVERGYDRDYSVVLLALIGGAALATLIGSSIAVALAMAESRPDMATLAAVGASPARRRWHAIGQAATVSSTGTVLGILLGALIAVATLAGSTLYPLSIPYSWLLLAAASGPVTASLVAGAFTRSRVVLTRRIT